MFRRIKRKMNEYLRANKQQETKRSYTVRKPVQIKNEYTIKRLTEVADNF